MIHLILGRKAKETQLQSFVGKPPVTLLRNVLHSGEFDERVLGMLIEQRRLTLDMTSPRPATALKAWLLAHLPLSSLAEAALAAAHSWRGILVALLHDSGIRHHVFDAARPGAKMRYLLSRIDAAHVLYAQPGPLLMARGLRLDRAAWTVSGHVEALSGEPAQIRLQMEARSKVELLAPLQPQPGGHTDFVFTLPESCRNNEDWFARIDVLRAGKRISAAPGTFRFTAREPAGRAAPPPVRKPARAPAPSPPRRRRSRSARTGCCCSPTTCRRRRCRSRCCWTTRRWRRCSCAPAPPPARSSCCPPRRRTGRRTGCGCWTRPASRSGRPLLPCPPPCPAALWRCSSMPLPAMTWRRKAWRGWRASC
ncbi:hypothetical protein ACFFMP_02305 [Pseudoroseomonas cervicalis]|uniref:hypothetical protein n=1 Tax=Teichococcus cervicalis TaxID=204525 RepID=UPI0035ED03B6